MDTQDSGARGASRRGRRSFLKLAAAALTAWRARTVVGAITVSGAATRVPAMPVVQAPPGYVAPRYLPGGFQSAGVFADRPDGFGMGPNELAMWFRHESHPLAWNQPLVIFQAPGGGGSLAGTERRRGEAVRLRMSDGSEVKADYHDGFWQPSAAGLEWAVGTANSVTFNLRGLRIGIRGGQQSGVSREELLRVAQSLN